MSTIRTDQKQEDISQKALSKELEEFFVEMDAITEKPPDHLLEPVLEMRRKTAEALPIATSGLILSSRCNF